MGQLKSDGKAINVTVPAGEVEFGELYSIGAAFGTRWNGIALSPVASGDTKRDIAMEVSERIWYVELPAGVTGAKGTYLYWTATGAFKTGSTDLTETATTTAPCAIVEEAKDANNIAGIRVLNVGPASS